MAPTPDPVLAKLLEQLDHVDDVLATQLLARAHLVEQIANRRAEAGLPPRDYARETEGFRRAGRAFEASGLPPVYGRRVFQRIANLCTTIAHRGAPTGIRGGTADANPPAPPPAGTS